MKILDLLAKLGILRYGTKKAVYHSAKDMPAEFLMDGVLNAERDLTTTQDVRNAINAVTGKKAQTTAGAFCAHCGKPVGTDQNFCASCGASLRQ